LKNECDYPSTHPEVLATVEKLKKAYKVRHSISETISQVYSTDEPKMKRHCPSKTMEFISIESVGETESVSQSLF